MARLLNVLSSMANLSRTASQFFINFLFIFTLTMTMYSFFRTIGALCGSLDIGMLKAFLLILMTKNAYSMVKATRITGVAIQALVVYTGRTRKDRILGNYLTILL